MVEFKKNVKKALPYDRDKYLEFWDDENDLTNGWNGVSIQLPGASEGKQFGLVEFVENYNDLFKKIVLRLDNGSSWIINHDNKDYVWFPNDEANLTPLRLLFKHNNVPNKFKGALIITKDDLLRFSRELISYPSAVFNEEGLYYRSLDISHGELQFIIKIYGRFSIDLQSTDKELLKKVIKENSSSSFIIKEFRGSSIW